MSVPGDIWGCPAFLGCPMLTAWSVSMCSPPVGTRVQGHREAAPCVHWVGGGAAGSARRTACGQRHRHARAPLPATAGWSPVRTTSLRLCPPLEDAADGRLRWRPCILPGEAQVIKGQHVPLSATPANLCSQPPRRRQGVEGHECSQAQPSQRMGGNHTKRPQEGCSLLSAGRDAPRWLPSLLCLASPRLHLFPQITSQIALQCSRLSSELVLGEPTPRWA